jgi:hypothetical protein
MRLNAEGCARHVRRQPHPVRDPDPLRLAFRHDHRGRMREVPRANSDQVPFVPRRWLHLEAAERPWESDAQPVVHGL